MWRKNYLSIRVVQHDLTQTQDHVDGLRAPLCAAGPNPEEVAFATPVITPFYFGDHLLYE